MSVRGIKYIIDTDENTMFRIVDTMFDIRVFGFDK